MNALTHSMAVLTRLGAVSLLAACASTPPTGPEVATCPPAANMLADPQFTSFNQPGKRLWSTRQHSRGRNFTYEISDGVLTIDKVGKEPWFVFSQRIDTALPAGTELQFDAMLALDTRPPTAKHGFDYVSGLNLTGKLRRRTTLRSMADHEPNLGQHPEQRVVSTVVATTEITQLDAGFIHQAGGAFSVRAPRLINLTEYPACRLD